MRKDLINTHASKRSANLEPGSTFESVGVFSFSTMLFPKPIAHEECDEQIFHYETWMEWNDLRREQELITLHQWHYLNTVADCWIIYYKKCKQLYTRQNEKNNNNI